MSAGRRWTASLPSGPPIHRLAPQSYHVRSILSIPGMYRRRNRNPTRQARRARRCRQPTRMCDRKQRPSLGHTRRYPPTGQDLGAKSKFRSVRNLRLAKMAFPFSRGMVETTWHSGAMGFIRPSPLALEPGSLPTRVRSRLRDASRNRVCPPVFACGGQMAGRCPGLPPRHPIRCTPALRASHLDVTAAALWNPAHEARITLHAQDVGSDRDHGDPRGGVGFSLCQKLL